MSQQQNSPKFSQKISAFFQNIGQGIRAFFLKCQLFFSSLFSGKNKDKSPSAPPPSRSEADPSEGSTIVFDSAKLKQSEKEATSKVSLTLSEEEKKSKRKAQSSIFRPRNKRPSYVLGTIIATAKVFGLALLVFIAAGVGAVFGVANAYLGTTPDLDLEVLSESALTSYIYDANGNVITTYSGTENREYASLDEIPKQLQQAVIAVEDVRFYHHNGVDLKRIISSFVGNMSSSKTSGGSTITQQLIKNQLLSPERSYKRKIQEANLALQLEKEYTKDQILEAYLNTIPLGGTIYGVKVAAKDYFGKELSELTLRESACIAGITQYPWKYSPRRAYYVSGEVDALNNRVDTVLRRMYTAGYITLDEMNAAMNDELHVIEKSSTSGVYDMPHFVEYGIYDVVTHLLKSRELEDNKTNRAAVENELRTKGYSIYLTVDPDVQHKLQDTIANYDRYYKFGKNDSVIREKLSDGTTLEIKQPQAASVVVDQHTGQIKAMVGSRDVPTIRKSSNRAYQSRMPVGSSIKPIAVYGPAFDMGLGLGSIIPNIKARIPGWGTDEGYPTTSHGGSYGPRTIRKGITSSLNIVAARTLMDYVGVENSYNYLINLGISPKMLNKDGIGLALGTSGISTLEMAGAYACIANGGEYREPLAFSQVKDKDGNIVLDAEEVREVRQVFKPSSAFMLVEALKEAVQSGTGTNARISGFTVAGKTGTNHSNRGIFFAGMTGHYTSTLWIGHDEYKKMPGQQGSNAAILWQRYMKVILEGKEDKPILEGSASDYGVTRYTVCGVSGMKCTNACSGDPFHPPVTDYFAVGDAPGKACNMHGSTVMCVEGKCAPGPYCPATSVQTTSGVIIPEGSPYANMSGGAGSIFPNLVSGTPSTDENGNAVFNGVCPIHTEQWALSQADIEKASADATAAISEVQSFMQSESSRITATQRSRLQTLISAVQTALNADPATKSAAAIQAATSNLLAAKQEIQANLPDVPPSASVAPSPSPSVTEPVPSPSETDPAPSPSPTT